MRRFAIAAVSLALLASAAPSHAVVLADFASGFSATTNPNGDWRFGSLTAPGGTFTLSGATTTYGPGNEVTAWSPVGTFWPTVALNPTAAPVSFGAGNVVTLDPGEGLLHPGAAGEYADVRYTFAAPVTATLDVAFRGIDAVGTTTDVHVLRNGVSLFSGAIGGYGDTETFNITLAFAAGDVIDFAVGVGSNGNFVDDSTGFKAAFSTPAVPEPGTWALFVAGLLGLALLRRARGRQMRLARVRGRR